MIFEQAVIDVLPANAGAFEAAVAEAAPFFKAAEGCLSLALEKVVEHSGRYVLRIGWTSVDAHTETFRNSDDFVKFRDLAGPFMLKAPDVIHVLPTNIF